LHCGYGKHSVKHSRNDVSLVTSKRKPRTPKTLALLIRQAGQRVERIFVVAGIDGLPDDLTRLALFDLSAHPIQRRVIVYIVDVKLVISGRGNVDDVVLGRITHSSLQNGVIRLVDCILARIVR